MFTSKKKKIKAYLDEKIGVECAFDCLLADYLSGELRGTLISMGIVKTEIYVDLSADMKCIEIQGRYNEYYLDVQIYPNEFIISIDKDEPDEGEEYPLGSRKQLYKELLRELSSLK